MQFQILLILATICCTAGATTVVTVQDEGAACSAMATTIPRLKTLTGMISSYCIEDIMPLYFCQIDKLN